jgi:hypothetical protein
MNHWTVGPGRKVAGAQAGSRWRSITTSPPPPPQGVRWRWKADRRRRPAPGQPWWQRIAEGARDFRGKQQSSCHRPNQEPRLPTLLRRPPKAAASPGLSRLRLAVGPPLVGPAGRQAKPFSASAFRVLRRSGTGISPGGSIAGIRGHRSGELDMRRVRIPPGRSRPRLELASGSPQRSLHQRASVPKTQPSLPHGGAL